jgi:hypothetical protein
MHAPRLKSRPPTGHWLLHVWVASPRSALALFFFSLAGRARTAYYNVNATCVTNPTRPRYELPSSYSASSIAEDPRVGACIDLHGPCMALELTTSISVCKSALNSSWHPDLSDLDIPAPSAGRRTRSRRARRTGVAVADVIAAPARVSPSGRRRRAWGPAVTDPPARPKPPRIESAIGHARPGRSEHISPHAQTTYRHSARFSMH